MSRRCVIAAVVVLATAVMPAAADTNRGGGAHTLIVAVKRNLSPAAEKKLSVLILISQSGVAPAAALATPSKPLRVRQSNNGLYRVRAEINSPCKGSCAASYRISGSANHRLEVVPACRLKGSRFVCSTLKIVKVY